MKKSLLLIIASAVLLLCGAVTVWADDNIDNSLKSESSQSDNMESDDKAEYETPIVAEMNVYSENEDIRVSEEMEISERTEKPETAIEITASEEPVYEEEKAEEADSESKEDTAGTENIEEAAEETEKSENIEETDSDSIEEIVEETDSDSVEETVEETDTENNEEADENENDESAAEVSILTAEVLSESSSAKTSDGYLVSTGDTTDVTSVIQSMLKKDKVCRLGTGVFYVSGIVMPDDSAIIGSGSATKIILLGKDSQSGYAIKMGSCCTITNLSILGNKLNYTANTDTYNKKLSYVERHGILWKGNASDENDSIPRRGIITNCYIANFSGGGITCKDTGYNVTSGLNVSDCHIWHCYAGINIVYFSEYSKWNNINVNRCHYGAINNGGNQMFSNCSFSGNVCGMLIDNSKNQSKNNTHGSVVNCSFNHSDGNSGNGIVIKGASNGELFSNCQIFYSNIYIANSKGISMTNFDCGGNINIRIRKKSFVVLDKFIGRSIPVITVDCLSKVVLTNCYTLSGKVGKISYKGHIVVSSGAVAATYTQTGLTAGKYCESCGKVFVSRKTVPKKKLTKANVTLSNISTGVKVKWNKVTDSTGYEVWRGSVKIATITSASTLSYTDTAAVNGTYYSYKVKAIRKESGKTVSTSDSKVMKAYFMTSPVISKAVNNVSGTISVAWNRNNKAAGYQIRYTIGTTVKWITINGCSNIAKKISSLLKGKTYSIYLRTFRKVSGTTYYSGWSPVKKVEIVN